MVMNSVPYRIAPKNYGLKDPIDKDIKRLVDLPQKQ
jgi:hypothetical protein